MVYYLPYKLIIIKDLVENKLNAIIGLNLFEIIQYSRKDIEISVTNKVWMLTSTNVVL